MLIRVMLCFLGKVEGVSRGIAVCTIRWDGEISADKKIEFEIKVLLPTSVFFCG